MTLMLPLGDSSLSKRYGHTQYERTPFTAIVSEYYAIL